MNSTDTETVADVLAEIRDAATSADAWRAGMAANVVMDYADRVEIAVRRELDHAVEHATRHAEAVARDNCRDCVHNPRGRNYEGGNAAAVREALVKSLDALKSLSRAHNDDLPEDVRAILGRMAFEANAALADATTEKSSAVGNAAEMSEALEAILRYVAPICRYAKPDGEQPTALFAIADTVRDIVAKALSAPPRNCDRFADAETARQAWLDDAENWDEFGSPNLELYEWLLAPAAERKGEGDDCK